MEKKSAEPTWPELLGNDNWEGLLQPLNLNLRKLILLTGDFCQATYDAFDSDTSSRFCGSSRYGKRSFFNKVQFPLAASSYFVDTFLYSTSQIDVPTGFFLHTITGQDSWDRESNFMGYVAVSTDEATKASGIREIYIAWRGTIKTMEWLDVFDAQLQSVEPILSSSPRDEDKKIKVMKGWFTIYTSSNCTSPFTKLSAREQLQRKIKELVHKYKGENLSFVFTGHSLGASLAVLSAFDIVENELVDRNTPVAAFVFGCPEVGNEAFAEKLKKMKNLRILHTRNVIDLIPFYPSRLFGYTTTGIDLVVDTRRSPSLKNSLNPGDWHNLQAILHVVAGWNGEHGEFELKVKRSVALVNKSCEYLKEECCVPGSWWVEKNRGMVMKEDGEWVLAPPFEEDMPVPEF